MEEEKGRNIESIFPVAILFSALISCHTCEWTMVEEYTNSESQLL